MGSDVATPKLRDAVANLVQAHWGLGSAALTAMFLPGATPQESETFSRNQQEWSSAAKAAELLRLSCNMSAVDALPRVYTESLIIHRRDDQTIPLEAGRRLAAELPQARFTVLDGNVHLPWINGDAIADMVHSFLAGKEATGSLPATGCRLDEPNRELVLDGRHEPTTRLEFGVMRALLCASGRVVTRDELLAEVWNTPFTGSNKVEAVVRSLRKKLGPFAASIETVTGHGYRFAGWKRQVIDTVQ